MTAPEPTDGSDRWTPVEIEMLGPDDWQTLRSARLAALRDSPDAFVGTLAAETNRRRGRWISRLRWSTWVVARNSGGVVGVACLRAEHPRAPGKRFIESVWVAPEQRRRGLVRRMLRSLEERARADGADYLQLWVLETNDSAYDAYLKLDFYALPDSDQDAPKPRGDGTFVQERLMEKPLL